MTDTVTTTPAAPGTRTWRSLGEIPGLDGVRGLAVLLVIMTHVQVIVPYGVTGVSTIDRFIGGGYLGVDLFFVLSGFLITALLLTELHTTSDLKFGNFYARRALRLLPALYVMLAIHAVYARWAELNWSQEKSTIFSAVLYVANWQWELRPFTVMRDLGLLWSLSIEEQFYLIWPALLMALLGARRNLRTVAVFIVAMIAAVAVWRAHLWSTGTFWSRLAVRTDTRIDALLIGALLAVLWVGGMTPKKWVKEAAWLGLAFGAWFVATSSVEDGFGYRGGLSLFALGIAAVILAVVEGDWPGTWFFQLAPMRAVGRVSYGLYLWHFPIFWAVAVKGSSWSNLQRVVAAFSLTTLFTLGSWYLVEQPALRLKRRYRSGRTDPAAKGTAPAGPPPPKPWNGFLVAGALILLGVVLVPLTFLVDEPDAGTAIAEPDGLMFPGGDVDRSGYWGLIDLVPTFQDNFESDDRGLGAPNTTGAPGWEVVRGTWTVDGGRAAVVPGAPGNARIAVAPVTQNDGLVEANLETAARGSGLVFRYADPSNFWAITADPETLAWTVTQRVDGSDTNVTEFVAPVYRNVTVSVSQSSSTIRFLVNGVERGRVLDPAPLVVLRAGLIELGDISGTARWDRFLVLAPEQNDTDGS